MAGRSRYSDETRRPNNNFASCLRWLVITLLGILLLSGCGNVNDELSGIDTSVYDRYNYPNLIDYRSNPLKLEDAPKNVFYDGGGWQGYSLPLEAGNTFGGNFIGPYLHDRKEWLSKSLVQLQLPGLTNDQGETASVSATSYPGLLRLSQRTEGIQITSSLSFNPYEGRIAAFRYVLTNKSKEVKRFGVNLTGEIINSGYTLNRIDSLTVSVSAKTSGALYTLRFLNEKAEKVKLNVLGNGYSFSWGEDISIEPGGSRVFYVIGIYHSGYDDPFAELEHPSEIFRANEYEWGYQLKRLPLKPSPENKDWNTIAVKALQTLKMNYREGTGDLGPIVGTIPSASIHYFNGFWAWDTWKHVVALATIDSMIAKAQLASMLSAQDSYGMIADCIFPDTEEDNWRDTKPPLAAWAATSVFALDTTFLAGTFPSLLAYHRWWYANRDYDKNGICEYGSTDGTIVAARWESGMDDAVRFDDTKMLKSKWNAWSMNQESVDLNAYLFLEKKKLAELAGLLGRTGLQDTLLREADWLKDRINERFFDSESGYYYDVEVGSGRFVKVKGPEGWIPLWAGVATDEIAARVYSVLTDTATFATLVPFPTVSKDEEGFMSGYWRGPVWLDQAYFAVAGLARYGYQKEAEEFGRRLLNQPEGLNKKISAIRENYNPLTGAGMKVLNFSWSAAHLLLLQHGLKTGEWK